MIARLRRFALVGVVVTAFDFAVLLVLGAGAGLPVLVADAVSVGLAAVLSRRLHRSVTFADEPRARWVQEPGAFVRVTLEAALVDMAVLRAVIGVTDDRTARGLAVAKAIALVPAAVVRFLGLRNALHAVVRTAQARRLDRGPASGDVRLSLVVPAYDNATGIGLTVERLRAALAPLDGGFELVVVDDGSADDTAGAARAAGADRVVVLPENRGKGAAVRAGALEARGRTIAFTDADLAYPPEQLVRVVQEVEAGWDVVVGSRHHVHTTTLVRARRLREVSGRVFNFLTVAILLGSYRDTQCGLKAFRSDAARLLFSRARIDRFAFDVELLHLAERYELTLTEVPVEIANTEASTVRMGRDSLQMVLDVFRIRRFASTGAYDRADTPTTPVR